jgi:hypothetical protein
MTMDFTPRLDILPPSQRRLWDELAAVPAEFVLYGGTAPALHLGHRESGGFDCFGDRPLDPALLVPAIPFLAGAAAGARRATIVPNGHVSSGLINEVAAKVCFPGAASRSGTAPMPTLSTFYGIVIQMYWQDHPPPHFHALYAEYGALIDIRTQEVIEGSLPRRALALVLQ